MELFGPDKNSYRISKETGRALIGIAIVLDLFLPIFNLIPILGTVFSGTATLVFFGFFASKNIRSSRLLLLIFEWMPIISAFTGWLPMFTVATILTVNSAQKKDEERIAQEKGY